MVVIVIIIKCYVLYTARENLLIIFQEEIEIVEREKKRESWKFDGFKTGESERVRRERERERERERREREREREIFNFS